MGQEMTSGGNNGNLKVINSSMIYTKLSNVEKAREGEKISDKSAMELNLNHDGGATVRKNVKGVKLVGMDGGTLRRPSLQVFSYSCSTCDKNVFLQAS